jgi:NAD(P)-dependent dehydrogenase (short-subunit alcohol dehydrogenase family)
VAREITAAGGRTDADVVTATFITARAAARYVIKQGSGVILALDSGSATRSPMMGGTGPADAATDSFIRNLAAEIGPHSGDPSTTSEKRKRGHRACISRRCSGRW